MDLPEAASKDVGIYIGATLTMTITRANGTVEEIVVPAEIELVPSG